MLPSRTSSHVPRTKGHTLLWALPPPTFIYRTRWALTAPIRPPATSFSITYPATSHTGTPPGHPHFPVHLQLSSSTYPATPNPLPASAYHPNQRANVLRTGLRQPPTHHWELWDHRPRQGPRLGHLASSKKEKRVPQEPPARAWWWPCTGRDGHCQPGASGGPKRG